MWIYVPPASMAGSNPFMGSMGSTGSSYGSATLGIDAMLGLTAMGSGSSAGLNSLFGLGSGLDTFLGSLGSLMNNLSSSTGTGGFHYTATPAEILAGIANGTAFTNVPPVTSFFNNLAPIMQWPMGSSSVLNNLLYGVAREMVPINLSGNG